MATIGPEEIGRRLREARDRKQWTQLEAASEAHVSPATIQRWEAGKLPRIRDLVRYGDLLGIPTEELVEPRADEDGSLNGVRRQLAAEVARFQALNDQLTEQLKVLGAQPPSRRRHSEHG